MDMKRASELQKAWGDKPCKHPNTVKEDSGRYGWSGDLVCTQCGLVGPKNAFTSSPEEGDEH
jgi:transcription initiation factor TFIIIB Brf1 subunit/transcription initiation factor TFIIB